MSNALDIQTTGDSPRWQEDYEILAYTAHALATQADDPDIQKLYTRVGGVLMDWERIEDDHRALRNRAIAARARVAVADAALDLLIHKVGETVLKICDGDRDSTLYQSFFPEPHEHVIALGLDGELPAASVVMAQMDAAKELDKTLEPLIEPLRQTLTLAHGALAGRADAYAELGRLQARVEAWCEDGKATLRSIHRSLHRISDQRGYNYRWTASFFVDGGVLA